MLESFDGRLTWQPYDPDCQLQELLPFYLGPTDPLDTSQGTSDPETVKTTSLELLPMRTAKLLRDAFD